MPAAAIDVGSNTLRMIIGELRGNRVERIYADRSITRLAEGVRDTGILRNENMERSLTVLKKFSGTIKKHRVSRTSAVGTSALREARNGRTFIEAALRDAGIRIEVISGMREALLTARGVTVALRGRPGCLLIIDIGGGSTEWIVCNARSPYTVISCGSFPVGVVNLSEQFIKTDPPAPAEIAALNRELGLHFSRLRRKITKQQCMYLMGTGGTVTTLASMSLGLISYTHDKVHMHRLTLRRLYRFSERLQSVPMGTRQHIDGLEPKRADLIIPGVLLTIKFMEVFGFHHITASDYGLLEGLLQEQNDENRL